jgi:hypothetical protein
MSFPVGRVLRSAAGRTPTARILGTLPTSTRASTIPTRLRAPVTAGVAAGFHTVPAARRQAGNNNNRTTTTTTDTKPTNEELASAAAGSFARTDDSITVEYPPEEQLPSSEPVAGTDRAGAHVFPTLATFSLQGKVGVVTGGARGLGLVMGREYLSRP